MAAKCVCVALNKRIEVWCLKSGLTLTGGGHINETTDANWRRLGSEWVEFKTRGSREFFRGDEIAADITHQITMRWSARAATYTTDMRIKFERRIFSIESPPMNIDEDKAGYIVMAAKEIK